MLCRIKSCQKLGHGDPRLLTPDDDFIVPGDDIHRVIQSQMGALQSRRRKPNRCTVAPLGDLSWLYERFGQGMYPVKTVYTVDTTICSRCKA